MRRSCYERTSVSNRKRSQINLQKMTSRLLLDVFNLGRSLLPFSFVQTFPSFPFPPFDRLLRFLFHLYVLFRLTAFPLSIFLSMTAPFNGYSEQRLNQQHVKTTFRSFNFKKIKKIYPAIVLLLCFFKKHLGHPRPLFRLF